MPFTRVLLVRHGATTYALEDRFAGAVDVPLSDEGRRQAGALAQRLRGEALAAVYASPLQRARDTAALVAEPHGLAVQTDAAFAEIAHGRWEGLTRAEVEARFPEEAAAWDRDPFTFAPEGGETGLAVTARALPALLHLVEAHAGGAVLVVSHKATIRLLLASLLGFDPRRYRDNLDQSPCALNVVDFNGPTRARLTLFNDTSHYAGAAQAVPDVPHARLSPQWPGPQG
jgi:broad specificity phosphatase PhoE